MTTDHSFKVQTASASDEWGTPRALFGRLSHKFAFTVDGAASADNTLLPKYYSKENTIFGQDLTGEVVFCNPPYSKCAEFLQLFATAPVESAVLLVPARPGTNYWFNYVWPYATSVCFVKGRLKFLQDGMPTHSAPFDSAIIIYGKGEVPQGTGMNINLRRPT